METEFVDRPGGLDVLNDFLASSGYVADVVNVSRGAGRTFNRNTASSVDLHRNYRWLAGQVGTDLDSVYVPRAYPARERLATGLGSFHVPLVNWIDESGFTNDPTTNSNAEGLAVVARPSNHPVTMVVLPADATPVALFTPWGGMASLLARWDALSSNMLEQLFEKLAQTAPPQSDFHPDDVFAVMGVGARNQFYIDEKRAVPDLRQCGPAIESSLQRVHGVIVNGKPRHFNFDLSQATRDLLRLHINPDQILFDPRCTNTWRDIKGRPIFGGKRDADLTGSWQAPNTAGNAFAASIRLR